MRYCLTNGSKEMSINFGFVIKFLFVSKIGDTVRASKIFNAFYCAQEDPLSRICSSIYIDQGDI